ncbi:MAG: anthranilate phosphoribosyltransferase, partial [Myxococcota bacterium]
MSLRSSLKKVIAGQPLTAAEAESAIEAIMFGDADPVAAGGLLTALATRGESVDEVTGAARAMRQAAQPFDSPLAKRAVDTCGTGGDGSGTFNISTAAAFVVAAAGVPVIKHGNRAVSSRSGSADLLQALGATIDLPPAAMSEVLEASGMAFLFAPVYHPAMRHAVPIRRSLGVRTLFNLLGPICNPAAVAHQVIGVFDARWLALADVLRNLGSTRAMVVHGADGLDELSLTGVTFVTELHEGELTQTQLTP